ncbi:MAG: hypothetical protein R3C05_15445 [Pirellulaceae bacterium]
MLSPAQKEQFAEALQRLAGDEQMLTMLAEIAADDAPGLLRRLADSVPGKWHLQPASQPSKDC